MLRNIDQSIVARGKIATVAVEKVANVVDLSDQQKEEYERQRKLVEYLTMTEEQKEKIQEEDYSEMVKSLEALVKKDKEQGKFEEMRGLVDTRTD